MKNYEKHLREILQNADTETVRKIAEATPSADVRTKERIFKSICTSYHIQNSESFEIEAYPAITESRFSSYRNFAVAAACLLVCGGVVGGLATLEKPLTTSEQTEQITLEELTEAISTTTAPVSNIKTAEKSDKNPTKETNSVQSKETVINTVPVIVPVAEIVPAVNAETAVNPETTAPTAKTTTVQTTAVSVDNKTKETLSADFVPLVNPAPVAETTAPQSTTNSTETTAISNETEIISLGAFRVEKEVVPPTSETNDGAVNYRIYVDDELNPDDDFVKYHLSYVPDGFGQTAHNDTGDVVFYEYSKRLSDGEIEKFSFNQVTLNYCQATDNGAITMYSIDPDCESEFSYETTTVNGYPAIFVSSVAGTSDIFWHDGVSVYRVHVDNIPKDEVMKIAESTVADYTAQKVTHPQPIQPLETVTFNETFTLTNIDADAMPDFVLKTYTDLALDYTTSIYQKLTPVMDDNDPTTIETRYVPTWFPNDSFTQNKISQTDTTNSIDYYANPYTSPHFSFSQGLKQNYYNSTFGDMTSMYEQITVDGHFAYIRNDTYDGGTEHYSIFWNDGDYVFQISAYGLSREELIKVAQSVKPQSTATNSNVIQLGEEAVRVSGFTIEEHERFYVKYYTATSEKEMNSAIQNAYTAEYLPKGVEFLNRCFTEYTCTKEEEALLFGKAKECSYYYQVEDGTTFTILQSVNDGLEFTVENESNSIIPISIGEHEGFMVRNSYSSWVAEGSSQTETPTEYGDYTIFWEQDGYVFEISVNYITKDFESELLKMAESMQPVK